MISVLTVSIKNKFPPNSLKTLFMIFNLLPIYPLDGFNALASLLKYTNPYVNFMRKYGGLVLIGVVIIFAQTGFFDTLVKNVSKPIIDFWSIFF